MANFITKKGFSGVELQGDYEFVDGSDGNWSSSILVGGNFGDVNLMAGLGWQHRSELPTTERDYGFQPYSVNPSAWSALGTPGLFVIPASAGGIVLDSLPAGLAVQPDVGCDALGGVQDTILCRFSFIPFDNLIEDTDRYQGYLQADVDLSDTFRFHGEFSYARTDMDSIGSSPG
ncbi:hypothetical protein, partial [Cellulomonas citrea]|uniref:hypothetical protein n=1 Tax=Cellulomonas citrea TaxID=1909423 RepID=UPI001915331E